MTAETITVDGKEYKVFVVYPSRRRRVTLQDGPAAGEALSHRKIRDLKGSYLGYTMSIKSIPGEQADYDALWDVLKMPVDYHRVMLPCGQENIEFDAAIYSLEDVDYGVTGETRKWSDMELVFEPMEPQWRPT